MITGSDDSPSRLRRRLQTAFFVLLGLAFLLITLVIVWRTNLSSKVDARLKAIRADGFPTSGAELDRWYRAVPDQENAALIYLQAAERMTPRKAEDEADLHGQLRRLPRTAPLPPELKAFLADKVAAQKDALELLHHGAVLAESRYPVDFSNGLLAELPHLAKLKSAAQLLQQEALLNAENGQPEAAATALHASLRLGHSLAAEPILISQLVRIALDTLCTVSLQRVLTRTTLPDPQLMVLMSDLVEADDPNSGLRAMVGERALTIRHFRMTAEEVAKYSAPENGDEPPAHVSEGGMRFVRATGFFERDLLFFLDTMATNIAAAGLPPPKSLEFSKAASQRIIEARRKYYILSGLLLPALEKAVTRLAEDSARLRTARAALGVERYRLAHQGRLPESLAALVPNYLKEVPVDPFDGKPIRYKRLAKGYVTYSIDSDGADNGGSEKPERKSMKDEGYDLPFTVER
ncbi:MAG TPA: hypothetical protein VGK40_03840 [Verrucomicrobiae bacterium]